MNSTPSANPLFRGAPWAAATATALLALTLGATSGALAFGGPHGHGGPGAPGDAFAPQMLEAMRSKLKLDSSQQQFFDQVAAQGKAARDAALARMLRVQEALNAELAKTEPDLAAVAAVADDVAAQNQSARRQVRDQWLKLYGTFSVEQKAVVREFMSRRLSRMESLRSGHRGPPGPAPN